MSSTCALSTRRSLAARLGLSLPLLAALLSPAVARADARDDFEASRQVKLAQLEHTVRGHHLSGSPTCIPKAAGSIELNVVSADLGLPDPMRRPVVLHGSEIAGDRGLLRFDLSASFDPPIDMATGTTAGTAHIRAIAGSITVRVLSEDNDDPSCGTGRFDVRFEHVSSNVHVSGNVDLFNYGFDEPLTIDTLFGFAGERAAPPVPPALLRLSISDSTLCDTTRDVRLWGEVALTAPAPAGGYTVSLDDSSDLISVPSTVTVPAGRMIARFPVDVAGAFSGEATVTASDGSASLSAEVQEVPTWLCREPQPTRMIRSLLGECLACGSMRLDRHGDVIRTNQGVVERTLGQGAFAAVASLPPDAQVRALSATTLVGTFFDKGMRGFVLRPGASGPSLEVLEVGTPLAANDAGDVVGVATDAKGNTLGFLQQGGASKALPTLGGASTRPTAIGEDGSVVGSSERQDGSLHGFVFLDGKMIDVGDLGGGYSAAAGVSDEGLVAGSSLDEKGRERGFFFDRDKGALWDIGSLGSLDSVHVAGVTRSGLVYGYAYDSQKGAKGSSRPFLASPEKGPADASFVADGVTVTEIVEVNAAGDMLVRIAEKDGFALLSRGLEKGL